MLALEGVIIKGYSGFYYVWDGSRQWECKLRGKHRLTKQTFLPGDKVVISTVDQQKNTAVIESTLPRRNELIRPPVCNIDQAVIVIAMKEPEPDFWLLDRLLIMTQFSAISPLICFNKSDLVSVKECRELEYTYKKIGFPVIMTSSKLKRGIDELVRVLTGKISVLAGPSGVGKSSLLNILEPEINLKTGQVSEKLARGKHTTRHVELIPFSFGGYVADTPGFSQVNLPKLKKNSLDDYYPDFKEYQKYCKFSSCLHRDEPQCKVKEAVANGLIIKERYERYLDFLEKISAQERRY